MLWSRGHSGDAATTKVGPFCLVNGNRYAITIIREKRMWRGTCRSQKYTALYEIITYICGATQAKPAPWSIAWRIISSHISSVVREKKNAVQEENQSDVGDSHIHASHTLNRPLCCGHAVMFEKAVGFRRQRYLRRVYVKDIGRRGRCSGVVVERRCLTGTDWHARLDQRQHAGFLDRVCRRLRHGARG